MTILVSCDSRHIPEYTATSSDGSVGYGTSPDEAIGHCVRESFLIASDGGIVIHDISSDY